MGQKFIIAIDQGTTGNRVFCFDTNGRVISRAYREFKQYFPVPGFVEHDGEEIFSSVSDLIGEAIAIGGLNSSDAVSIGITNQRETVLLWEKDTGKPVHRAIVWQCRRTSEICKNLKEQGHEELFRNRTGLLLDPYFSGTKITWLFQKYPELKARAEKGEILAGTMDAWLLFKLTGEFATDPTNASRTLLFNIHQKQWDPDLAQILGVPVQMLPRVVSGPAVFGRTKNQMHLPDGIPVTALAGDQQSALFGQLCTMPGEAKNTYGTGAFLLMHTGSVPMESKNGLITTIAFSETGGIGYALEGSVFIAGAVIQWLRDQLRFFNESSISEELARQLDESSEDQVVFVPAFAGLGAPHWNPEARGTLFGLTRDTSPASITRAALKSIALQSADLVEAMEADTGEKMSILRADGGASSNSWLMQYQSDILGIPVEMPENPDTTALGAAYLSGIGVGVWDHVDDLRKLENPFLRYDPVRDASFRNREKNRWKKAVTLCSGWSTDP